MKRTGRRRMRDRAGFDLIFFFLFLFSFFFGEGLVCGEDGRITW